MLASVSPVATAHGESFSCGTGRAAQNRAAALFERQGREGIGLAPDTVSPPIDLIDGVAVMQANDKTASYLRPFDLAGTAFVFTPAAGEKYLAKRTVLPPSGDRGMQLALSATAPAVQYRLPFDFPMFGVTLRDVWISEFNGIHASMPPAPPFYQYDALELLSPRSPLISPMFGTPYVQRFANPRLYVRETEAYVTFTWATPDSYDPGYDVRATLFRDGGITFSYVRNETTRPYAVVVTSGAENWRRSLGQAAGAVDPLGDVPSYVPASVASMLDVVAVRASRVAGLNLLRFEFDLAAPPDPGVAAPVGELWYELTVRKGERAHTIYLEIRPDRSIQFAGLGRILNGFRGVHVSAAALLEGRTLTLELTDDLLPFIPTEITIETVCSWVGDQATLSVALSTPHRTLMSDLSSLSSEGSELAVVIEAFTRPAVSLLDVWARLQEAYGWRNDEVDAVAVYENFDTDIGTIGRAYALVGNTGVDGIGNAGSAYPRLPNLIDMAKPEHETVENHDPILLHEFGHRWLLHAYYRDPITGEVRRDLNPDSAHPAEWVDTRAAFPVARSTDCSTMGGAIFTERSDGAFDVEDPSPYGFSWLELYLMGLAGEDEVDPVLWLADTDPPLSSSGFPYGVTTVRGTKHHVTTADIAAVEGPRKPAFPMTQRRFTIIFVFLVDPSKTVAAEDIAAIVRSRNALIADFAAASGGRGQVVALSLPERNARRRSARH